MKIHLVEATLFHLDRRTDGKMDGLEEASHFEQFCDSV